MSAAPAAPAADRVAAWRDDTPGADRLTHLNNAGAALMPAPVHRAVVEHLERELVSGGYEAADAEVERVRAAYADVGRLLGASARNLAVVQNSTVAFAQALAAFDFAPGDVIVTSRNDYASNQIMYLSLARRRGVEVVRAEDAAEGGIDPESVREVVRRRRPVLVAITWVPTNSGLVQPVEAIGEVCETAGVPYLIDGCQALGQIPIDVARLRCDYLAATARKFLRGPRAVGLLYVSDRALEAGAHPLLPDMHGATWTERDHFDLAEGASRFETWELSHAGIFGLGAAARYAAGVGLDVARDRARALAGYARRRLAELDGVRVLDRGPELCAIVTAELRGLDAGDVKLALRRRGINTSSPHRSDAVIDMDDKHAESALRLSPHYYNTEEEIDVAVEAIGEMVRVPRVIARSEATKQSGRAGIVPAVTGAVHGRPDRHGPSGPSR